jgi:hypothetical protein
MMAGAAAGAKGFFIGESIYSCAPVVMIERRD